MFRVVVESFETAEEAVQFRNMMNDNYRQKHAHVEQAQGEYPARPVWYIWTFK